MSLKIELDVAEYFRLYNKGLPDTEIAKKMFIHYNTLQRCKRDKGIVTPKQRRNFQGITRADFEKGHRIGLNNRMMLKRVRVYGWSIEQAISTPSGIKRSIEK